MNYKQEPWHVIVTDEILEQCREWSGFNHITTEYLVGVCLNGEGGIGKGHNRAHITKGETYDFGKEITSKEFIENVYIPWRREKVEVKNPNHYDNSKGSIYQFCENQKLNAYEFDIIKRVVRCRKKGQFKEDLEKTKALIDLYLSEFE